MAMSDQSGNRTPAELADLRAEVSRLRTEIVALHDRIASLEGRRAPQEGDWGRLQSEIALIVLNLLAIAADPVRASDNDAIHALLCRIQAQFGAGPTESVSDAEGAGTGRLNPGA